MFARPNIPKILTFLVKYLVPTTLNVGAALAHIFRHYYGWQMETSEDGRVAVNRKLVKCDFHAKEARVVNRVVEIPIRQSVDSARLILYPCLLFQTMIHI